MRPYLIALPLCAAALHAQPATALTIEPTRAKILNFLGAQGGLLAFVDKADGDKLKVLDLGDPNMAVRTIETSASGNPQISLDGTRILYTTAGTLYAHSLSGGNRVKIADVGTKRSGGLGYWYREGGADYVVYCDSTDKGGYGGGETHRVRLKSGIHPDGAATTLYGKAYDGGITPDGRWIGEAYGARHAYNLDSNQEYSNFLRNDGTNEGQCCNASMAPLTGPYRMATLVLPHSLFRSWQYDASQDRWEEYRTYTKPSGTEEWQTPEWSRHPDFITVTAKQGGYDLYIQHARHTGTRLKVIDGNIATHHLYVGAVSTPKCTPTDCDDGDPCTDDACIAGTCQHNPVAGCCSQASQCDDADPCTQDACTNSRCAHQAIAGCCSGPAQCDDGNPCTQDRCSNQSCDNTPIAGCCTDHAQCNDQSPCTTDQCANNACVFQPISACCQSNSGCIDNNPCTVDQCDQKSGTCSNAVTPGCCLSDKECDDHDPCTQDQCSNNACRHHPISGCCTGQQQCDDQSPCTKDECTDNACRFSPIAGCCEGEDDCSDNNPCTTNRCDPGTGECINARAPNCCHLDAECIDEDPCTLERCDLGTNECVSEPSSSCLVSSPDEPSSKEVAAEASLAARPRAGVGVGNGASRLEGGCRFGGGNGGIASLLALLAGLLAARRRQKPRSDDGRG